MSPYLERQDCIIGLAIAGAATVVVPGLSILAGRWATAAVETLPLLPFAAVFVHRLIQIDQASRRSPDDACAPANGTARPEVAPPATSLRPIASR